MTIKFEIGFDIDIAPMLSRQNKQHFLTKRSQKFSQLKSCRQI